MKKVLFVAFLLGLSLTVGNAQVNVEATELATNDAAQSTNPNAGSRDAGDFLYYIDVEGLTLDIRLLGVEHDASDWWVTGANDMAGAYLYQISHDGLTLINSYATGHTGWGWRDLALDDAGMLYASDSYVIEQIDPATGAVTGVTIASPVSPARALAYVPATDSFWTASFSSSLYDVARDGTFTTYTNPGLAMYGAAYEATADVVWWWSQDGSGTLASAMDPATGTFTGDSWDGGSAPYFGIAGGACVFDDPMYGTVFAGMHQASPDNVAVYEILPDPNPQVDIKCNGKDAGVVIADTQNATLTIDVEARGGAGIDFDIFCIVRQIGVGRYTYDGTNWNHGLKNCYFSGALADMSDTVLDQIVPVGDYMATIVLDRKANGVLDTVFAYDQVDFKVQVISGFFEDFEDGVADNWVPDGAHWSVGGGTYNLDCPSYAFFLSYYDWDYSDFTFSADMRMLATTSYSNTYDRGIYFRSADGTYSDCYLLITQNDGNYYFRTYTGGSYSYTSGAFTNFNIGVDLWNNVGADARGSNLDILINGVIEFTVTDTTHTTGKAGIFGQGSGGYNHDYEFDNCSLNL